MPELFIYLLKVNISLALFCLAYYGILRKLTFYNVNRIFLLAGIAFSSVYPFIDFASLFAKPVIIPVQTALPVVYNVIEQTKYWDYQMILKTTFWLGVLFMAVRMGIRFLSLYRIHKNSVPENVINYPVRLLSGQISTFSFWQNIYLNPEQHQEDELLAVLEHEHVHVKQWHTIDILAAELSTVFYWFNPGVWYMRKAVKENIEFITDQKILQKGVDRKAYQYSMISAVNSLQPSVLMNNFNLTAIKRRIIMMNSKRSGSIQLMRYILIVPVLLAITFAFTLFRAEAKANDPKPKGKLVIFNKQPVSTTTAKVTKPKAKPAAKNKINKVTNPVKASTKEVAGMFMIKRTDSVPVADIASQLRGKVQGKLIVSRTDPDAATFSAVRGDEEKVLVVKGFKMQPVAGTARKNDDGANDVVTVEGRPTSNAKLKVPGFNLLSAKIFIDGREASEAEYKLLKSSKIEKVSIKENKDSAEKELHIFTNANN